MQNSQALVQKMRRNAFQDVLAKLYCCSPDETDIYAERFAGLLESFDRHFPRHQNVNLFSVPGRAEIGGNHTDHQRGCVLAGSVNLDIVAAAASNGLQTIRVVSDGQTPVTVELGPLRPDPRERFTPESLIRGIASQFVRDGYRIGGFDLVATSEIPQGSGLSSSAAFEVLIGVVINELFCAGEASSIDVAKFSRHAENVFFGKPSGLMDPLAAAVGGFLFIDFADEEKPAVEKIPFDLAAQGYALCIVDSGAQQMDLSGHYAAIPAEMGQVAAFFGKSHLREVGEMDLENNIAGVRRAAGDRALLRALHFMKENRRVADEARALRDGCFDEFLRLVGESGLSSSLYLQNTRIPGAERSQEVDIALALCREFLGGRGAYRVHGGGFAGTVQAFVPVDMLDSFILEMNAALGKKSCHVLSIRQEGAVRLA